MRAHFVLAIFFLAVAQPAAAQVPAPACNRPSGAPRMAPTPQILAARSAMKQACAADARAFCGDVAPGCGRPTQCLKAHGAQLSATCASALQQLHVVAHVAPR